MAKRYLCFKEADYLEKLSPGSKRTLEFQVPLVRSVSCHGACSVSVGTCIEEHDRLGRQGGPMTAEEARIFEQDPLFEASKQMRRWDEEAKYLGLKVPDFGTYQDKVLACITGLSKTAAETLETCSYIRKGNTVVGLRA